VEINRRRFFTITGAGIALLPGSSVPYNSLASPPPMPPDQFNRLLRGPMLSFPTTYDKNFEVDYAPVRRMIDRAADAGIKVFTLTSGNNQYDQLSYDEIKALTRVVVESVAGRGVTIAATGPWWTGKVIDYARFAESVGASAVQVSMSSLGDEDSQMEHFKAVAKATRLALVVHGQPSLGLMKRLLTIESIVAFKEEFTTDYTVPLYEQFGERLNIFAGGTKARFLAYEPYGMHAYYSLFSTCVPTVAMRFWAAVQNRDTQQARDIILKYDAPLFERFSMAFWQGTLEHFGIAKRYRRPPDKTLTEQQMGELRVFYDNLGLDRSKV